MADLEINEIDMNEIQLPKIQTGKLENVGEAKPLTKRERKQLMEMMSKFENDGEFKNLILPDFLMNTYPENFDGVIPHERILEESKFTNEIVKCNTEEDKKNKIKERLQKRLKQKKK